MKINKRLFLTILIFTSAGLLTGALIRYPHASPAFSRSGCTVVLDAGHGDPDGGAVGASGTIEKDINLAIAQKTREVFEGRGINVIMTREGDSGLHDDGDGTIRKMKVSDMHKRRNIMEKSGADLFISIHMNYFPKQEVSGLRIFYDKSHPGLEELANSVQNGISSVTGAKCYAVKTADERLFLMKNPPIPCLLTECGFLSNHDEEKLLCDEKYQSKIAWALADAVINYLAEH